MPPQINPLLAQGLQSPYGVQQGFGGLQGLGGLQGFGGPENLEQKLAEIRASDPSRITQTFPYATM